MKELTKYLKKKKYILLFLGVLFAFGVVVGVIIGLSNMGVLESQALYFKEHMSETSYQYVLLHFFFLSISLFTSYFGIGIPILLTLFFYEGMSFGFLFALFTSTFHIGGLLFAVLFLFITCGALQNHAKAGIVLILICFLLMLPFFFLGRLLSHSFNFC